MPFAESESSSVLDRLYTQPIWLTLVFSLGLLASLYTLLSLLTWLYVYLLCPIKNLHKYGSWAIITGPTDDTGKGFAFYVARSGLNLVLVARNPDKLRLLSDSIWAKYSSTLIKIVVVDFSGNLDDDIRRIRDTIHGLEVGILINNVGVFYPCARFFHEVDEELLRSLIKVNVEGTTNELQAQLLDLRSKYFGENEF